MKRSMSVAMLAMITMALLMVQPAEAISCGELAGMLLPCLNYLRSGGSPGASCCAGAKRVQGATRSQADRRDACKCAKTGATQYKVDQKNAASLPSKCGISTPIPSPSVNCDTLA
ncbi:plant lipid transfer protein/Par allergen [Artemisia annua]|uniref:Non-specific lipid-transfer protein n=1 Tax=Artemisia annua TaxID=35608 RepID=A0A2U1M0H1_ARTAN|nr:plant lipid transfer protein/Par allergen [Artemisia annua]